MGSKVSSNNVCYIDGLDPLQRLVLAILLLLILLPMTLIATQYITGVVQNLWSQGQYLQAIAFLLTLTPLWFIIGYGIIHLAFAIMCMRKQS